ncbi:hypothetical protein [Burkholderia sp. ABCPW 14]|nr:hypothetical protein [Burkholderia sp. ABCPW 14]
MNAPREKKGRLGGAGGSALVRNAFADGRAAHRAGRRAPIE